MLNDLLDVVAKYLVERLLNNDEFVQQLAARVNVQDAVAAAVEAHDFTSEIEDVVNCKGMERAISDAVETAIDNANIERTIEDAVESAISDLDVEEQIESAIKGIELTSEQIADFSEAAVSAVKQAL